MTESWPHPYEKIIPAIKEVPEESLMGRTRIKGQELWDLIMADANRIAALTDNSSTDKTLIMLENAANALLDTVHSRSRQFTRENRMKIREYLDWAFSQRSNGHLISDPEFATDNPTLKELRRVWNSLSLQG